MKKQYNKRRFFLPLRMMTIIAVLFTLIAIAGSTSVGNNYVQTTKN